MAGGSCCLNRQIILTTGDIERISQFVGTREFYTMEAPESWYLEPSYDPDWLPLVMKPGNVLRVLKRNREKNCEMLTDKGCRLPFSIRPLICQLHPYMHTEKGILGVDESCPISKEKESNAILEQLDMPLVKAREWQKKLYLELNSERNGMAAR